MSSNATFSRSVARGINYTAKGERAENLALMRRIDELFIKYSFYGSRQMAGNCAAGANALAVTGFVV